MPMIQREGVKVLSVSFEDPECWSFGSPIGSLSIWLSDTEDVVGFWLIADLVSLVAFANWTCVLAWLAHAIFILAVSLVCWLCQCFDWVTTAQQTQQFLLSVCRLCRCFGLGHNCSTDPVVSSFRLQTMSMLWLGSQLLNRPSSFFFPFADYVDALVRVTTAQQTQ